MMSTPGGQRPGIHASADAHGIPVWRVGDLRSERTASMITTIQAELLVCACFNRKIPASVYRTFPLGGVNVHPSMLPDKRGPDPQFWTFKEGTGQAGVTIHRLTHRFDAGPVLDQAELSYPDGISETELDHLTAEAGAHLLTEWLPAMSAELAAETEQDHTQATYAPFPTIDDFRLDRDQPARSAYNFIRGVGGRGVPILVEWKGHTYRVEEVLDYASTPPTSAEDDAPARWIPFTPGWALLRLAEAGAE